MTKRAKELLERVRAGDEAFLAVQEIRLTGSRVSGPSRDSFADELAAFANARGGVCVLGVDDKTHTVTGFPWEAFDAVEAFARDICLDSVEPPVLATIERLTLPNSEGVETPVLRVDLGQCLFVHRSPGGYFHQVGSSKRQMSPEYLARLFQQRSQSRMIRFDEQAVPGATLEDLSDSLWRRMGGNRF